MSAFQEIQHEFTEEQCNFFKMKTSHGMGLFLGNVDSSSVNADGKPWTKCQEKIESQLEIYSSVDPNSSLLRYKAICVFDYHSPSEIYNFMADHSRRTQWDSSISAISSTMIQKEDLANSKQHLELIRYATNTSPPVTTRDFVDVFTKSHRPDGTIISSHVGLMPEETFGLYPVNENCIRAFNHCGCGMLVEPYGQGCKATFVLQTDMKGWFLSAMLNAIMSYIYISFFDDLKKAMPPAVLLSKTDENVAENDK